MEREEVVIVDQEAAAVFVLYGLSAPAWWLWCRMTGRPISPPIGAPRASAAVVETPADDGKRQTG